MNFLMLFVFMLIAGISMAYIVQIALVQTIMADRGINPGEFLEFGVMILALTLAITFVASFMGSK